MKNYPNVLADMTVLHDVLCMLYNQAEDYSEQISSYEERMKEDPDCTDYYKEQISENAAKAAACVRLAEKLAK